MTAPLEQMKVTSPYGDRIHPVTKARSHHNGVDLAAQKGEPIAAPFDGKVTFLKSAAGGLQLLLTHSGGLCAGFAHLSGYRPGLAEGSAVREGEILGYTGATGRVTGPHLHFTMSVRNAGGRKFFDPLLVEWT